MSTVTESRESQGTDQAKRPLGHLQAKIDAGLLDRADTLATRRSIQLRRKIYRRDVVEEALQAYLPDAEREAGIGSD